MILHIEDLRVGFCYSSGDDCEYLCVERTNNFAIMLNYERSHYVADLEFWNDDTLFNIDNLQLVTDCYPIAEYLDKFQYVDKQKLKLRS